LANLWVRSLDLICRNSASELLGAVAFSITNYKNRRLDTKVS